MVDRAKTERSFCQTGGWGRGGNTNGDQNQGGEIRGRVDPAERPKEALGSSSDCRMGGGPAMPRQQLVPTGVTAPSRRCSARSEKGHSDPPSAGAVTSRT
jgi:hypothetical protein